jgi:hypothetical protein
MRLWTLHPQYLDAKGLVALWREALLAKAVHAEATARGYAFDRRKIGPVRDSARHRQWRSAKILKCHPLFSRIRGPVADWERP